MTNVICQLVRKFRLRGEESTSELFLYYLPSVYVYTYVCPQGERRVCVLPREAREESVDDDDDRDNGNNDKTRPVSVCCSCATPRK